MNTNQGKTITSLFIDIDGTLFSSTTHSINQEDFDAIKTAHEQGIRVFISTGRHLGTKTEAQVLDPILPYLDGLVSANGQQCLLLDGTIVYRKILDHDDFLSCIAVGRDHEIPMLFSTDTDTHITFVNDHVYRFNDLVHIPVPPIKEVDPESEVMKVAFYMMPEVEQKYLLPALKHSMTTRFTDMMVDVVPEGTGKDRGVREMCGHFGLKVTDAMAFGDGENDISSLRAAGIGVAMGNAPDIVKAAADYVTESVDNAGISAALCRLGVIA